MMPEWTLRKTSAPDLDRIVEIEKAVFADPWSRKAFEFELTRPGGIFLTAEAEDRTVGYAVGWAVSDEIHVANLAVDPARRRKGIGRALLVALLGSHPAAAWAGLEVRRSNGAAIALYEKFGFRQVGVRKRYYVEEGEDAILMEMTLPETKRGIHDVV